MKMLKNILRVSMVLPLLLVFSCKDQTEMNINPNGVAAESVNPSFLMSTVLTETGKTYVGLGFGDMAGVMQHTQKDAWSSGHNDYDWSDQSWSGYYGLLRTNKKAYERAEQEERGFTMGVSLVMKSFLFGMVTDLWGDAPYTNALNGDQGGKENLLPAYDSQDVIYQGIIDDLKSAQSMLAGSTPTEGEGAADVYYGGDAMKWQKFANSLLLRYYMRISEKMPDVAKAGIESVVSSGIYFKSNEDDATMDFVGSGSDDSWPSNWVYDNSGSNFRRIKMCATFVDTLEAFNDPRLDIWAAKVQVPIVIDANYSSNPDTVIDSVRYIHPSAIPANTMVDTDPNYVGIPPSIGSEPSWYNLNPTPGQLSYNPHVSYLNEIYKAASGPLLKSRLISFAEVNFILAEAALKGWNVGGTAQSYYEAGVKASLDTWGVGNDYDAYIAGPNVAYNGTLEQIITQKWIASWSAATEAWFDYRRTGYPELQAGPKAKRERLPVRFYYGDDELKLNADNIEVAMKDLEETNFSRSDGENSAWSKPWLLQGTGEPW